MAPVCRAIDGKAGSLDGAVCDQGLAGATGAGSRDDRDAAVRPPADLDRERPTALTAPFCGTLRRNLAQSRINCMRLSSISPRRYAASTLSPTACASAISDTSFE